MTTAPRADLAAIALRLAAEGVTVQGELAARLIAGGRSNLTYELTDDIHRWVLRRPPTAGLTPSAHDMAREHRVTSALVATGVPVAPPVLLCEDTDVIGAPFTIVEFVEGASLRAREDLEAISPSLLASTVENLIGSLAGLHAVDPVKAGLGSFARPDGYAARQLRRWSGQWELVGTSGDHDAAERLATALAERLPDQARTSVVHGDYRSDNVLVDLSDEGRVAAIVDWELSTLGDPVADVALMCTYRHPVFDRVIGFPCAWTDARLPAADDLAASYERSGGVPLRHWEFHLGLAHYKLAVIAAGIDHRQRAEGGTSDGADTAIPTLLEAGMSAVRGTPALR